jgi:transposase InsO family protein
MMIISPSCVRGRPRRLLSFIHCYRTFSCNPRIGNLTRCEKAVQNPRGGQQLKCLTVTDEFTKVELAIDMDGYIRTPRVINVLSLLVSARGAPAYLRSDNGPKFVSKALLSWIVAQGIGTGLIEPGKP